MSVAEQLFWSRRFCEHRLEVRPQVDVLAAEVEDADRRADGARRDRHALEHEVGVLGEDHAVLERARLALVGVADDVLACRRP